MKQSITYLLRYKNHFNQNTRLALTLQSAGWRSHEDPLSVRLGTITTDKAKVEYEEFSHWDRIPDAYRLAAGCSFTHVFYYSFQLLQLLPTYLFDKYRRDIWEAIGNGKPFLDGGRYSTWMVNRTYFDHLRDYNEETRIFKKSNGLVTFKDVIEYSKQELDIDFKIYVDAISFGSFENKCNFIKLPKDKLWLTTGKNLNSSVIYYMDNGKSLPDITLNIETEKNTIKTEILMYDEHNFNSLVNQLKNILL